MNYLMKRIGRNALFIALFTVLLTGNAVGQEVALDLSIPACTTKQQNGIHFAEGYKTVGQPILGFTASLLATSATFLAAGQIFEPELNTALLITSSGLAAILAGVVGVTELFIDDRIEQLQGRCTQKYRYVCPHGFANEKGYQAMRPGEISCLKCKNGYELINEQCVPTEENIES